MIRICSEIYDMHLHMDLKILLNMNVHVKPVTSLWIWIMLGSEPKFICGQLTYRFYTCGRFPMRGEIVTFGYVISFLYLC